MIDRQTPFGRNDVVRGTEDSQCEGEQRRASATDPGRNEDGHIEESERHALFENGLQFDSCPSRSERYKGCETIAQQPVSKASLHGVQDPSLAKGSLQATPPADACGQARRSPIVVSGEGRMFQPASVKWLVPNVQRVAGSRGHT